MRKMIRGGLYLMLIVTIICAFLTYSINSVEAVQSSDNYSIDTDVLSGGGGECSSAGYYLWHTTGQPTAIGISSSASYTNYAGFWYTTIPICGIPFTDIPSGFWAEEYIKAIYCHGITTGYPDNTYRPSEIVNRAQMAAFIIRAKFGESFTYNTTPHFTDVPDNNWAFKYIQKMKDEGITTGCTPTQYCPSNTVTRQAMAAFIIRALFGETFTYTLTPYFIDVTDTNIFFKYVQKMKDEGITTGCTATEYCPMNNVTRAAMAAFLARAFLGMP